MAKGEERSPTETAYSFALPLDHHWHILNDDLFGDLISSRVFKRLKRIRFLGSIDYVAVPSPNGLPVNVRYNRFQHSIGVGILSSYYSEMRGLSVRDSRLVCAAALLHDIGHGPLSHSLEPVFEEKFNLNHHNNTINIIVGKSEIGKNIWRILKKYSVDPDDVVALLSGTTDPFDGFFSGPVNFDTIEGILRSRQYISRLSAASPLSVLAAAFDRVDIRDREVVDDFWNLKGQIYERLIGSRVGVLADQISQQLIWHEPGFIPNDFELGEDEFFKKYPNLKRALIEDVPLLVSSLSALGRKYNKRRFFVESAGNFFARNDKARYRQEKIAAQI